ncbi:carbamoyltransferase HypF [Haloferax sp. S1W]|uniref:carbamoyltransferase HypF n=1 Tax=Haloferax sp. S1W TaxID=3377110 RepID=UPI0037CA34FC
MERATVRVDGVVQSVGFRPFVYRTATDIGVRGTVRNLGDAGVRIELEGSSDELDAFLTALRDDNPPLARVETLEVERESVTEPTFETFDILESTSGHSGEGGGTIPPDTAMCDACRRDMRDGDSRYHDYWATSCVDCGPRFTVIESLPYDRPTTSMSAFPMCDDCRAEYETPTDRRYHAQTIACPQCGPSLRYGVVADAAPQPGDSPVETPDDGRDPFPNGLSETSDGTDAIAAAARSVVEGDIVVVKGIGGAHLVCDATDSGAVTRLRERTGRPTKPFALMAPNLDAAEGFAHVSERERDALTSPRRPILLVDERDDSTVTTEVAPGLHNRGVMLPYSGVHHLLFDHLDIPIVCTSANLPGEPMLIENGAITDGLVEVADGFLLHDRRIVARCDDSVARVVDGQRRLIRRSRGYAPTPVPLPAEGTVLALGPELDVTPAVLAAGECFLTQYVGNVDDIATFEYLQQAVDHLLSVTGLSKPPVVAHDAHPAFHTTEEARRLERAAGVERETSVERIAVQHHHAHAASVLAEHDREAAIAVTIDGVGYGSDGTVWGGEVLDATRETYERVGGLAPMDMPGGDRATRIPGRMLAGGLFAHADYDAERVRETLSDLGVPFPNAEERDVVCQQLETGVNTPTTTSAGRFLDAVSALLSVCGERRYEGEPAMRLEALASEGSVLDIDPPRTRVDGRPVVDAPSLLAQLADLARDGTPRADVAATAQDALARGLADIAIEAAGERDRETVALSGGVAYNDHIARRIRQRVTAADLEFLGNERVPPGDGGIAYGQATVAAARQNAT